MGDINSTQELIKIIRDIANQEIKEALLNVETVGYGTVTSVNADDTINVQIAGGKLLNNMTNKCGETLDVGSAVILKSRSGNLGNGYIAIKMGKTANTGGSGGTTDYNSLTNRPIIDGKVASSTLLTSRVRNVTFSTTAPTSSDGASGDIWIVYTE